MTARRGELWWVEQPRAPHQSSDASTRRRPYLVVSSDTWNQVESYPRITVCPLTGLENVPRRYDTDVVLRRRETGLVKDSVVRCVEVYTLFRDLLIERIGVLSRARVIEVDRALALYFGLPDSGLGEG